MKRFSLSDSSSITSSSSRWSDAGSLDVPSSLAAPMSAVTAALIAVSGVLLFAADFETYLYSRFFWAKMGLVALLIVNGALLWSAGTRANRGDRTAWGVLRLTAVVSIALWLLTTLGGVALPNIG
jgi:hypothetical protein